MRDLTYGLYGLDRAIARSAMRLMALRPSENTVNPYALVSGALRGLIDQRRTDPLAAIPIVTTTEFLKLTELPEARHTRPRDLVDLYPHGIAECNHARTRLRAATVRRSQPDGEL